MQLLIVDFFGLKPERNQTRGTREPEEGTFLSWAGEWNNWTRAHPVSRTLLPKNLFQRKGEAFFCACVYVCVVYFVSLGRWRSGDPPSRVCGRMASWELCERPRATATCEFLFGCFSHFIALEL